MNDRYQGLRDAIAAGPTRGKWILQEGCSWRRFGTLLEDGNILRPVKHPRDGWPDLEGPRANLEWIAAADPDTIAALLKERDALRDALSEAQTRIAAIGYPASPDGEYSKDGEWTFSDAVPRAVDAEEVKAAFLVIRAALADGEASNG